MKERKSPRAAFLPHRLIPGLILGFLVLLALILVGDLRNVSGEMLAFRWELYPLVLLLAVFNFSMRFIKWQFFLRQIGVQNLPVLQSARLFVAGFPLAVTPGKVGEALKGPWLKGLTGVPAARGVSVVLAERISDGLGVLGLSTLGVIAHPHYWPAFAAVLTGLLGVIVVSQIRPLALSLIGLGERLPFVGRFTPALHEFYEGSFALFRPKANLIAFGLGLVSWFAEGVAFFCILVGLGLPPGSETLSLAVFVMAFSTVIGAVSALPGGLGATEASLTGMLVFLLGMGAGAATTATLLIRFATLWFAVAIGLLVWLFSKDLLGIEALGKKV